MMSCPHFSSDFIIVAESPNDIVILCLLENTNQA